MPESGHVADATSFPKRRTGEPPRDSALALAEARRVRDGVEAELELVLSDLATWVDIDTPGGDLGALDGFAHLLAHTLARYGLEVELLPAPVGLHVHGVLEGSGSARVALVCHHDTVYPLGTAARRPFRREGERCYGPGVADMKGGIVVAAHTARLLALGPRPFGRLELVSVPDEESRFGPPATVGRLDGFDACLCLECGRPGGEVVSARKGASWLRIHAEGRAAHAGQAPGSGRNAAVAIAREALRLTEIDGARPGLTLQVTGLEAGEGLNTVPSSGSLTADIRAATQRDLDWAVARVRELPEPEGVRLRYENLGGPPPFERTPPVGALAERAIELGAALGHEFGEAVGGGVSDGSWTAHLGFPTLDGLGPVGGDDHSPGEYVETASFPTRCGVVAGLVASIDAGLLAGRAR